MLLITTLTLTPLQHASSLHCSSHISYMVLLWENLFKCLYISESSLVIISFLLMICMFDQALSLLGEIGCGSLLELKRLLVKNMVTFYC